jgi:cytochrome c556
LIHESTEIQMTRPSLAGRVLAVIIVMAAPILVHADDDDVIEYRQHIMKTMGEQADAIDMILQGKAPVDNLATHLRILAITAATAKKSFEPKVLGGRSKPDVWAQWPDFAKRLDVLAAATDGLAKTAKEGGVATTAAKFQGAIACKSCHDAYLAEKK